MDNKGLVVRGTNLKIRIMHRKRFDPTIAFDGPVSLFSAASSHRN